MSLQVRLTDLITAIGADIKALRNSAPVPPSYVTGTLTGKYNKETNWFNVTPANTRRTRASIGKARAGQTVNWLFIGDSETDAFNGVTYDALAMHPQIFRNIVGCPVAGTGAVKAGGFAATPDPRWTFTGGWAGTGASYSYALSAGTATFITRDQPGTNIDIVYGSNASSPFNYAVYNKLGVQLTSGTITPSTAAAAKLSLTGLVGAYRIVFTYINGTAVLFTANIYTPGAGLLVHNLAYHGAQTSHWTDVSTYYSFVNVALAAVPTPDVVVCTLLANDVANAVATATTMANLQTIRNKFPSSDFILCAEYQAGASTLAAWQAAVSAMYGIADTIGCPLLDLLDRSGGYTIANAYGLMGDATHPNQSAQADWAVALASLTEASPTTITQVPASPFDVTNKSYVDAADFIPVPPFKMNGTLTVKTGTDKYYNDFNRPIQVYSVRASVNTAPTGAPIIVDLVKNGVTMYTTQANRPTIAVSTTTIVAALPNVITLAPGEYISVDVDQIGSTIAGADLTVQVIFVPA